MAPFDSEHFPLPRPIPEGHRRMEDLGFASPQAAPSVDDAVLRVLIEARARVAKGYCMFFYEKDGSHCAQGALWASHPTVALFRAVREALISAMDAADVHPDHRDISLMLFNDRAGQDGVLSLFDRAIAARRAELEQAPASRGEAR